MALSWCKESYSFICRAPIYSFLENTICNQVSTRIWAKPIIRLQVDEHRMHNYMYIIIHTYTCIPHQKLPWNPKTRALAYRLQKKLFKIGSHQTPPHFNLDSHEPWNVSHESLPDETVYSVSFFFKVMKTIKDLCTWFADFFCHELLLIVVRKVKQL